MDLRRVGHPPQYVFSRIDELKAKVAARGVDVIDFARAHDMVVVCGLAYGDITFDGYRAPSTLQVPGASDVAVELVSLSKRRNMAGCRLGFVAGNAEVVAGPLGHVQIRRRQGLDEPGRVARARVDDQVDVVGRARLTLEAGHERDGEHVRHAGLVERCDDAF